VELDPDLLAVIHWTGKSSRPNDDVRDAALIGAAQRVEHYEMAGYGCARAFAEQLGNDEAAKLLQQTLEEESAADKKLTKIATQKVNQAALAGKED
jgi:ferritin-like metal-binding protein YciE